MKFRKVVCKDFRFKKATYDINVINNYLRGLLLIVWYSPILVQLTNCPIAFRMSPAAFFVWLWNCLQIHNAESSFSFIDLIIVNNLDSVLHTCWRTVRPKFNQMSLPYGFNFQISKKKNSKQITETYGCTMRRTIISFVEYYQKQPGTTVTDIFIYWW